MYSCLLLGVLAIILQLDDFFTHDLDFKYYRNMNEFKTIITKLKEIITQQLQTDKKVLDKDIAAALGIKPSALASHKSRDKPPYKAILTYCHNNRLDIRKILFDEDQPIIDYPKQAPVEAGKVRVKYFGALASYGKWLDDFNVTISHKTHHTQMKD